MPVIFIPALVFPYSFSSSLPSSPHSSAFLVFSARSVVCVCVCVCVCARVRACTLARILCLLVLTLYPHVQAPAGERARICFSATPLAPLLVVVPLSASFSSVGCHTPSNTAQVLARMPSSFISSPIFACITSHAGSSSLTRGQNCVCTVLPCSGSTES